MEGRLRTDLLTELLAQKHALLEQLRQLSVRQSELVAASDLDRLLRLLAARQTLAGQLQQVQLQLEPFRLEEPESRQWRTPQARSHCRDLAERCELLLVEILELERQSEAALSEQRIPADAGVADFLRTVAVATYGQDRSRAGGGLDVCSEM